MASFLFIPHLSEGSFLVPSRSTLGPFKGRTDAFKAPGPINQGSLGRTRHQCLRAPQVTLTASMGPHARSSGSPDIGCSCVCLSSSSQCKSLALGGNTRLHFSLPAADFLAGTHPEKLPGHSPSSTHWPQPSHQAQDTRDSSRRQTQWPMAALSLTQASKRQRCVSPAQMPQT